MATICCVESKPICQRSDVHATAADDLEKVLAAAREELPILCNQPRYSYCDGIWRAKGEEGKQDNPHLCMTNTSYMYNEESETGVSRRAAFGHEDTYAPAILDVLGRCPALNSKRLRSDSTRLAGRLPGPCKGLCDQAVLRKRRTGLRRLYRAQQTFMTWQSMSGWHG